MTHFETVVGDVGPASSKERRDAFLTAGPEMVEFLERCGVRFARCDGYSDYYSDRPGGKDIGRAIEPVPWNAKALGDWRNRLQPGLAQSVGLAVMTNESRSLSHYNRSVRCFAVAARVVVRTVRRQGATAGAVDERGLADRPDAACHPRPRDPGVDRGAARRSRRGGRPRRRGAHGPRRQGRGRTRPPRRAPLRRRVRPQPGDARGVQRRPAEQGQVVDRQPRRHRRGAPHRDPPRRRRPT